MDMSAVISLLTVSLFCFTFVFWLKKFENKHKYKKAKLVDLFIRRNNISVNHIYVGSYFDLIDDAEKQNIWFFYLKQNTLHYKNIPYANIFQVEYKLDHQTVKSIAKPGKLKRDLVVGNDSSSRNEIIEQTNIPLHKEYRVKEIALTILIDELTPTKLDFVFISSHFPVELKNIKDKEAKNWFQIFTHIIELEEEE